jgi:hypothetical protein
MAHGLAIFGAGYLGWLPAAGLYRPAHRDMPERNAFNIAAHLVWGAGLGLLTHELRMRRPSVTRSGPQRLSS